MSLWNVTHTRLMGTIVSNMDKGIGSSGPVLVHFQNVKSDNLFFLDSHQWVEGSLFRELYTNQKDTELQWEQKMIREIVTKGILELPDHLPIFLEWVIFLVYDAIPWEAIHIFQVPVYISPHPTPPQVMFHHFIVVTLQPTLIPTPTKGWELFFWSGTHPDGYQGREMDLQVYGISACPMQVSEKGNPLLTHFQATPTHVQPPQNHKVPPTPRYSSLWWPP